MPDPTTGEPAGPVLILAATAGELGAFLPSGPSSGLPYGTVSTPVEKDFLRARGRRGALDILFAETGTGKANAAFAGGVLARAWRPRGVIVAGCAGALPEGGLRIGDVAIATAAIFADEGVETAAGFLDLRAIGLPLGRDPAGAPIFNEIPLERHFDTFFGSIESIEDLAASLDFAVAAGPIATVSAGSGSEARAREIERRWRPLAEAMEGAAAALAALRLGCPCIEVRGISNLAGERDRASWRIDLACGHAAAVVGRILDRMAEDTP